MRSSKSVTRRPILWLALLLAIVFAFGAHSRGLFAQNISYAPGVEGQIWQQLPTVGRGFDSNERPITTVQGTYPINPLTGFADIWPCSTDPFGFPSLCYSSGVIGFGPALPPNDAQTYGGRFAPCVLGQCYPSGLVGVGAPVPWAVGPCSMRSGASGTDCWPVGVVGSGTRVAPVNGQLAGPSGIAVDNAPNVGTIYVTDKWNHRVQAFLFDGAVVPLLHPIGNGFAGTGSYTENGLTGEQLSTPESIKVDASGRIIVADSGNGRVAVFDRSGALVDSLVIQDANSGVFIAGLAAPTGLALTPGATFRGGAANPPGSRLIVTDKYNCSVYVFDASAPGSAPFSGLPLIAKAGGIQCADVGQTPAFAGLGAEEGAAVDSEGHVYVADYDRNRIEIFDAATATLIAAFGDPANGALGSSALHGPTDVMVDHRDVYTEGTSRVARIWVVDQTNQRLAMFKVNFDQPTPVATFQFELNAAGDLNGFPGNIAEDTSRDPVGKIVTTDSGNSRIQRFQVPDLAIVNVVTDAATLTVTFDVVVPAGKELPVTTVTPIVCPTSANTTVSSGTAAAQPTCATARALSPNASLSPGQSVSYSFQFATGQNTATFDIFATGNPLNGVPQTTSNHRTATFIRTCSNCSITPRVLLLSGALEAFTVPVAPSVLYVGTRVYTTQVSARVTATSSVGLAEIRYRFLSGPETANNAQPGLHAVTVSGTRAFVDIPFRLDGQSVVEFWATNTDGIEVPHRQAQLTLHLIPPNLVFRFDLATSTNATGPNANGWWNAPVSLPVDFSGQITAVTGLGAGMPARPALTSPLSFTTEGRNLGYRVTVTDSFGLAATKSSNDPAIEGQPVNLDMTAPVFVKNATLTLERDSFAGAVPPADTAPGALALAADKALTTGQAGSGLARVAPTALVSAFPFGSSAVSFTATDAAGNAGVGTVTVRVQDTIKPVITGPAAVTGYVGPLGTIFSLPGFSVFDASMIGAPAGPSPVTVTQSPASTVMLVNNQTVTVTLTATDPSGNAGTFVTTVTAKLLPALRFTRTVPNQTIEGGTAPDLNVTAVAASGAALQVTSNAPAVFPLGSTLVTFRATDAAGQTITWTATITVVDTRGPAVSACAAPRTVLTQVGAPTALPSLTADVSASDFSTFTVTQLPAAGTVYTIAAGQISLTVPVTLTLTDNSSAHNTSTCVSSVTFSAASTPVCGNAVASPSALWPPNHRLVPVTVNGVTNADGARVAIAVTGIFQDEPTQGRGDGDTAIDGFILPGGGAQVRAERSGRGDGRVYYLSFTATSTAGAFCTGTVKTSVPHDQAHPAVGQGARYNSTVR